MVCGLREPFGGLRKVLRHALARGLHEPQVGLRTQIPTIRRQLVPLDRFSSILRHAAPKAVTVSDKPLRPRLACPCGGSRDFQLGGIVTPPVGGFRILHRAGEYGAQ